MIKSTTLKRLLAGAAVAAAVVVAGPALAKDKLRICASTKEAPYSAADGSGFENRIAARLAVAMDREPEFVYTDKFAIYIVGEFLDAKKCDVVMGADVGDERMLTTAPIYRTGYVYVSREDKNFTGASWNSIADTDYGRFAIRFYTPAEVMLKYAGKWEDNAAYLYGLINFKSRRNQYNQVAADQLVSEVANGGADLAIAFAPDVARYVKSSPVPLRMTMIEDEIVRSDGKTIPLQYDQAIGVRKDDRALLDEISAALPKIRGDIDAILTEEGIPLLPPSS
ncbi:methanol oxidation system protein MoxJ [Methylobrevis pamukkalensis]|uniref:MxaJ protein n=1 Tax=Methylobrevis pamukkalensis TaxID=1439726 RepID=A0A1E3H642_9HYPH|nr:methanol oxidation system protein MoxJ [Methylobrevis pamukkalensis]ODN71808.1 mxaJ protein [Methylobrevis pamukkalensis]